MIIKGARIDRDTSLNLIRTADGYVIVRRDFLGQETTVAAFPAKDYKRSLERAHAAATALYEDLYEEYSSRD